MEAMASCQSVTYVNNELIGDPLEIKMMQDTQWVLKEATKTPAGGNDDIVLAEVLPVDNAGVDSKGVSIIKRFDFESKLQRMSVIVKDIDMHK